MKESILNQFDGNGYDWDYALNFSSGGDYSYVGDKFDIYDIEYVLASRAGENDGNNWVAVLYMKDGKYIFISAGCDYTGWDCQAGGHCYIAKSREELKTKVPLDELDDLPYNTWLTVDEAVIKYIVI